MNVRILVTGFAGSDEQLNASGELAISLSRDLPGELADLDSILDFELLYCNGNTREEEHLSVINELSRIVSLYKPGICIFTGQAPIYNRIRIERFATNYFLGSPIDADAPAAYAATLPGNEEIPAILNGYNLPSGHSNYAGQHTCNHILFSLLHLANRQGFDCKAGFIHIPVLPEQVANASEFPFIDSPHMTLEQTRTAVVYVIRHVVHKENSDVG